MHKGQRGVLNSFLGGLHQEDRGLGGVHVGCCNPPLQQRGFGLAGLKSAEFKDLHLVCVATRLGGIFPWQSLAMSGSLLRSGG